MSDFYTYRNEVAGKKRKRSLMLALLIVLAAACAGVGWFWMQRDAQPAEGEAAAAGPISTSESTEAESEAPVEAAAPAEPVSTGDGPARIVQAGIKAVVFEGEPREDLGAKVAFEMFQQAGVEVFRRNADDSMTRITTWA